MKKNVNYYYSDKYGVGVWMSDADENHFEVFFEDGERHAVLKEMAFRINEFLQNEDYYTYYYKDIRNKGKALFTNCRVRTTKDKITKQVRGTFLVDDSPVRKVECNCSSYSGLNTLKCSCGTRGLCAHVAAVQEYFKAHVRHLKDVYVDCPDETDKSLFPSGRFMKVADHYLEQSDDRMTMDECLKLLNPLIDEMQLHPTADYIAAALDHVFSNNDDNFYGNYFESRIQLMAYSMCMKPELYECISRPGNFEPYQDRIYFPGKYKNIRAIFKRAVKAYRDASKDLAAGDYTCFPAKEFILRQGERYCELLKYYSAGADDMQVTELMEICRLKDKINADDPCYPEAVEAAKTLLTELDLFDPRNEMVRSAFVALLSVIPKEERISMLSQLRHLSISPAQYEKLDIDSQKLLAKSMPADIDTVKYIIERVLCDAGSKKLVEYIVCALQKVETKREMDVLKRYISKVVDILPSNALLKEYLDYYYFGCEYKGKKHSIQLTEQDYRTYFEFYTYVDTDGDSSIIVYNCNLPEADDRQTMYLCEVEGRLKYPDKFLGRFTEPSICMIKTLCMEGNEEAIRKQQEEALELAERRNFLENNKDFIEDYEILRRKLSAEKIILTDSFKVRITYLLYSAYNRFYLGFKVGNVKDYVVKSAESFLHAFATKSTITYGKDLVLTHDYDNLAVEDRKVIQTLSGLSLYASRDAAHRKYVYIEEEALATFLDVMKGRMIYYNDEPCKVRLDDKEVRICINENYEISTTVDAKTQQFFIAGDQGYVYDKLERTIDCVVGDSYRMWVTDFCEHNKGVSIKPILQEFKKDIYSGNVEAFDITPSITKSFKLSTIKIKAYFDYEDKKILLREEIQRDDQKISRTDIADRSDSDKLKSFDAYIARLGFEDNAITDESKIMSFFRMDFSELKKLAHVYLSDNISSKRVLTVNRAVVRIRSTPSGIMEAFMEQSEYSEEELEKILQGIKRRKKYIFLDKDRIVDLDSAEAAELGEVVKDLGLTPGALYEKKRIGMVNAIKAFAHSDSCSIDKHLRNMMEEIRNFKDYEIVEPKLQLPLRGYQSEGYRWLSVLSNYGMGGILADDMGLGKTLQIIALIKQDKTKAPSLIVCPKSLVFNWINEFAKFDGTTETVEIYGTAQAREQLIRNIDYKKKTVYITSYDSLRNDIAHYGGKFAYCILDEAQFIKNVDAQKSKSVKEIKAVHRFALTGTPIENDVVDLWSIFDFIMPGYFEELGSFKSQYNRDPDYTARIAKRIGPFVLRRIKENVLGDLPDKFERIVSTEMTKKQRKLYDAVRMKAKERLDEGGKAFDMLPYLTQMRQICVDPKMCFEGQDTGSGKMEMLRHLVPEYLATGHRMLIFSQFVKGLNQVEDCLKELGVDYYMITGDTDAKARMEMIEDFNSGSGIDVFLISLKAGGTGINLTGADTVIHLDPWWNVAAENQATDRAHRIGQTRNVEVIKLISEDSIEQRVLELQNMKKDLFDRLISSDERSVTGASLEDIAFILR